MRLVFTDKDLSGRALDASQQPDGHARESLFLRCNLDGAVFLGDWRGSDFIACRGAADFSQAQVYACYFRGWQRPDLFSCRFPADIGYLHHEPVAAVLHQELGPLLAKLPPRLRRKARQAVEAVRDAVAGDWQASWRPSWRLVEGLGLTPAQIVAVFSRAFEHYPVLLARFQELVREAQRGELDQDVKTSATLVWPDGAQVTIDALSLPPLPETSRHALKLWAQAEADRQAPGSHYCFIWQVLPLAASPLPEPDAWLTTHRREGF